MPRRKITYPEKPWTPDPDRWRKLLQPLKDVAKRDTPDKPNGGWRLWDWKTLEDKPQE